MSQRLTIIIISNHRIYFEHARLNARKPSVHVSFFSSNDHTYKHANTSRYARDRLYPTFFVMIQCLACDR